MTVDDCYLYKDTCLALFHSRGQTELGAGEPSTFHLILKCVSSFLNKHKIRK